MKRIALMAAGVFAAALAVVCAAAPNPEDATPTPAPILSTEISGSDLGFFTATARATALVTQLAGLAKSRAVTPEVRAVAEAVGKEQTDAVTRLTELAGSKHVPLPQEPDGEGKKQLQTLAKLKGEKFDKSFLDALSDAQDKLEASLGAGAASEDKDIKAFGEAALGTLKQERERVRKLGM